MNYWEANQFIELSLISEINNVKKLIFNKAERILLQLISNPTIKYTKSSVVAEDQWDSQNDLSLDAFECSFFTLEDFRKSKGYYWYW